VDQFAKLPFGNLCGTQRLFRDGRDDGGGHQASMLGVDPIHGHALGRHDGPQQLKDGVGGFPDLDVAADLAPDFGEHLLQAFHLDIPCCGIAVTVHGKVANITGRVDHISRQYAGRIVGASPIPAETRISSRIPQAWHRGCILRATSREMNSAAMARCGR
jgi:hypothetical protein